ncbi:MAG TPA: protein kinase, partial [Pyrinomonadaceae bacterium]|nr:protein kinase [Pyrinomonadaceae bacterium]
MLAADENENSLDSGVGELGAAVLFARKDNLDQNIGRRVGKYKIVREIGRGGMGAVYEAVRDDAEFEQRVAIKLIRRGMDTDFILRRFRHERQILANLNHPFIARLFDGGTTDDGLPYFVMEYVEGKPINQFCEQNNLTLAEKLRLIEKVCQAVAYAHKKQIVHRDIKPGNILVTNEGEVKLLDFGIAKILNPEHSNETIDSMTGRVLMTPEYASPEQVRGLSVTPATDVYSLGVLFYQLLTGKHPYKKFNPAPHELARSICEDTPIPPSIAAENKKNGESRKLKTEDRIAVDLDSIILKSLQKEPGERYASAIELAADLERFLNGQTIKPATTLAVENKTNYHEKTIAVLPFKFLNLSLGGEDTDKSFLGLGLTDALITRLSNVRSLTVRPTSAVLKYGSDEENLFVAGSELRTNFVLDGRVSLAGERLRVTVQLISVQDKSSLWAGQYDENFTDIFAVQDSISAQVARALETELTDAERKNLARRGTQSAAAYEAYLRGRAISHSYTEEGIARAIQYFRQAADLDPNYAAAHSGIADIHVALGIVSVLPPAEAFGTAKKSAQRAVELDPNLAEAYASLGFATLAFDWNAEESERLFRKSFALNDNFAPAHEWFAHVLAMQGRFEEAITEMKRALRIDPQSAQLNSMTAYIYHNARRHREGVFYIERALELEPNNYLALQGFGWMYPPLGRGKEAIPYCRRAVEISNRAPLCLWVLAQVLAGEGELAEAREIIQELKTMQSERYVSPYYFGMLYTALGDFDEAFHWLEKTIDKRVYWAHWLAAEYRFDPLRKDARFKKLLERFEREKNKNISSPDSPRIIKESA